MTARPVLHLMIGMPGAGKTTRARRLASEHGILRLTPDEWMLPLFEGRGPRENSRDVMEGRLLWVAHEVLRSGSSVVVDFGCWSAEERWGIRALAEHAGAELSIVACEVDEAERMRRCLAREAEEKEQAAAMAAEDRAPVGPVIFEMTEDDHRRAREFYVSPTPEEYEGAPWPPVPDGQRTWTAWAAWRWPSLPDVASDDGPVG